MKYVVTYWRPANPRRLRWFMVKQSSYECTTDEGLRRIINVGLSRGCEVRVVVVEPEPSER